MYVYTYIYICTYIYVHIYVHCRRTRCTVAPIHMWVSIWVHTYMYLNKCVYIYACIHIQRHQDVAKYSSLFICLVCIAFFEYFIWDILIWVFTGHPHTKMSLHKVRVSAQSSLSIHLLHSFRRTYYMQCTKLLLHMSQYIVFFEFQKYPLSRNISRAVTRLCFCVKWYFYLGPVSRVDFDPWKCFDFSQSLEKRNVR